MLLYHGSSHRFSKPDMRAIKKYCSDASSNNEGYGLYCSTDLSVAQSYGKYTYVVVVDDKDVIDFSKMANCKFILKKLVIHIRNNTGVDITPFIDVIQICNGIQQGRIGVAFIGDYIRIILDNSEKFYSKCEKYADSVLNALIDFDNKCVPKMYKVQCNVRNVVIIKDFACIRSFARIS